MKRTRSRKTLWVVAITVALLGAAVVAWRMLRPTPVSVAAIVRGTAVDAVYATGSVEPEQRVAVKSRLPGHVAELLVREGDVVTKGQRLARIDAPSYALALTRARVQLRTAVTQASPSSPQLAALEAQANALAAELSLARTEQARVDRLVASGALPAAEGERAATRVVTLTAQMRAVEEQRRAMALELASTRAQLATSVESLASDADDVDVLAPLSGVVLRRRVELGELVQQNQVLYEVADVTKLLVELQVDEADVARVRDGRDGSRAALTLYAFEGKTFAGRVLQIMPEPDRVRRSFLVKVKLDEPPPGMRAGMSSEANIVVGHKDDALLAPVDALDGERLWVIQHGRATRKPVTVGIRDLARVEVLAGVEEGTLAIVDAQRAKIKEGSRVDAHVLPPPASAHPASGALSQRP